MQQQEAPSPGAISQTEPKFRQDDRLGSSKVTTCTIRIDLSESYFYLVSSLMLISRCNQQISLNSFSTTPSPGAYENHLTGAICA